MHPLKVVQPYPFNQWWVAAYAKEVTRQILPRTILGYRMVFYRTEGGDAVGLSGICPHRSFPLEKGHLVGDALQCGYHGFTFDQTGTCVHVPSQVGVPTRSNLRKFPVAERGELIWVWTGEEGSVDFSKLPDVQDIGLGVEGWAVEQHPMVTIQGRYTLLIDNLLDLSHVSFIHSDTIPGGDAVAGIPVEVLETTKSLMVQRVAKNLPPNPYIKFQFPANEGPVDQHFDAEYLGPNLIRTGGTVYEASHEKALGTQNFIHCITPESPGSVHYHVITARDFGQANAALGATNLHMGTLILPQDMIAIEAIEKVLQSLSTAPREVSARVDTGALKARYRLEQQIKSELGTTAQERPHPLTT